MKRPTALILIVLAIALFFAFTSPQYAIMQEKRALAAEYRNVIDNVGKIIEKRDQLLVSYQAVPAAEIDKLFKALPDKVDSVRLALDLDAIAGRHNISITSVGIVTGGNSDASLINLPGREGAYTKIAVSVSFISDYENFIRFLTDLERSLRIMDIKSVFFQSAGDSLYEHELVIETYWLSTLLSSNTSESSAVGADLLKMLNDLSQAILDQSLFSNPEYLYLTDFSTPVPSQPLGRSNPFAVFGQ